jgi:hypothetical protein
LVIFWPLLRGLSIEFLQPLLAAASVDALLYVEVALDLALNVPVALRAASDGLCILGPLLDETPRLMHYSGFESLSDL